MREFHVTIEVLSDDEENELREKIISAERKKQHYEMALLCNNFEMMTIVMK